MDKRFTLSGFKNPLSVLDKEYSLPDEYSFGPTAKAKESDMEVDFIKSAVLNDILEFENTHRIDY